MAHLLKNTISAHTLFKKPYQEEFTITLLQEKKYEMDTLLNQVVFNVLKNPNPLKDV